VIGLRNRLLGLALMLLLAACHKADEGRSATGQVLQGTVSDNMIPLDKLTSEAPLAAPEEQGGKPGAKPTAGPSGEPSATPSGEPSAAASPAAETAAPGEAGGD